MSIIPDGSPPSIPPVSKSILSRGLTNGFSSIRRGSRKEHPRGVSKPRVGDVRNDNSAQPASINSLTDALLKAIFWEIFPHLDEAALEVTEPVAVVLTSQSHPRRVSERLMLVSHRWQRIILDNSEFWSLVLLHFRYPSSLKKENLEMQLQRSGDMPIDIFIRHRQPTEPIQDDTLRLLRGHLTRIRCISGLLTPQDLGMLFPPGSTWEMSKLQIFNARDLPPLSTDFLMGPLSAPQLVYLALPASELAFRFISPIPYEKLIYLYITSNRAEIPCSQFLDILRLGPNLRSLVFLNHCPDAYQDESWPTTKITLLYLNDLSLSFAYNNDSFYFLRSLYCPNLKRIRCTESRGPYPPTETGPTEIFWHISLEFAETLEDIVIAPDTFAVGINVMEPLVRRLENLTTLYITSVPLHSDFFEIFLPNEGGPYDKWCCPRLRTLSLAKLDIEGDALVRVIRVRSHPDEGEPKESEKPLYKGLHSHLQSVTVESCCFLQDSVYELLLQLERSYSKVIKVFTRQLHFRR